jgi:hypothetical protein
MYCVTSSTNCAEALQRVALTMAVAETVADFVRSFRGGEEALARRKRWCFSQ